MYHNFRILLIREYLLKILAFFGQLILAGILMPKDFGFFVIISFIISFFSLFTDIGLSSGIIQKKDITTKELSAIWSIKLGLSVCIILFIFFIAPVARIFFPILTAQHIIMIRIQSVTLLLSSIRSIPVALLEKNFRYDIISAADIAGIICYYITAIIAGMLGWGVWSLIWASIMIELVQSTVLLAAFPFIPSIHFGFKSIRKMLHFGIFIQGGGILNFLVISITPIVAGTLSGARAVGLLNFAWNIFSIPESITNNFGRVAFVEFAKMQDKRALLSKNIEKSINLLSSITLLFALIIFSFAHEAITILYKPVWEQALPALYWYTGVTLLTATIATLGQGFLALGKSKYIFLSSSAASLLAYTISFILIKHIGFTVIAFAYFIYALFLFFMYIYLAKKERLEIQITSILLPKFIILIATLLFSFALNSSLPHLPLLLLLKGTLSLCVYIFLSYLYTRKDFYSILKIIRTSLNQK